MKHTAPHELHDLAEEIGTFIRYWGFKRVHGRIWAHLFVSSEALDAGTLIRRLNVSKALISISLKELLKYKVIRIVGQSEEGTQTYDVNPDVTSVILNVLKLRERKIIDRVSSEFSALERLSAEERKKWKLSASRMEALEELIQTGKRTLDGFLSLSGTDMASWQKFRSLD